MHELSIALVLSLLLCTTVQCATLPSNAQGQCISTAYGRCAKPTMPCAEGYVYYDFSCVRKCSTKGAKLPGLCKYRELCLILNAGNAPLSIPNVGVCIPFRVLPTCEDACIEDALYVENTVCWSRRESDVMKCHLYCARYPC